MKLAVLLALSLFTVSCKKEEAKEAKPAPGAADHVAISVTENGFEPKDVAVPAAKPVTLVFTRKTDQTCAKQVVITLDDGKKIEKELPLDTPVEIATTFPKAGKINYACGMDMDRATITVQ
jgi:plastocyanin domain-containing protein